jgi:hypothetical protein
VTNTAELREDSPCPFVVEQALRSARAPNRCSANTTGFPYYDCSMT